MVNERIRAREVRLVGSNGDQKGVVPMLEALRLAREEGLDLVLIAPNASPPVAKIADHGKLKYEKSKHDKEMRKSQRVSVLKEIKLTPKIGDHDLEVRVKKVRELLEKKNKIKLTMFFRGREMVHKELGLAVIDRLLEKVQDLGAAESKGKFEGRRLVLLIVPK
ncbi:MAG: translation initiation factor IF-3 [Candidatus Margulisbacteria bacterium]|nr:translation initiation factor IF-3 [Candidatus Margulisiibacteriota bacterium]